RRFKVFCKHSAIAVVLVDTPGDDNTGISPTRHSGESFVTPEGMRRKVRIPSVVSLCIAHIPHPFGKECPHVEGEDARLSEYENIAHPAQPFIALRTIGWNTLHVPALGPADVLPQL